MVVKLARNNGCTLHNRTSFAPGTSSKYTPGNKNVKLVSMSQVFNFLQLFRIDVPLVRAWGNQDGISVRSGQNRRLNGRLVGGNQNGFLRYASADQQEESGEESPHSAKCTSVADTPE